MKTGSVSVNLDGDSYQFLFSKAGGAESKGKGQTGIDDNKYIYKFGMKMKADSEDKYKVVYATGDTGDDNAVVEEIDTAKMRGLAEEATNKNKDGDTIKYVGSLGSNFYLVNTSGTIVKNKTAAKDGDDWYFYVENKQIVMYSNNKTLTAETGKPAPKDVNGVELRKAGDKNVTIDNGTTITLSDIIDR